MLKRIKIVTSLLLVLAVFGLLQQGLLTDAWNSLKSPPRLSCITLTSS
ncbi:hypothetical protein O5286_28280, partial [Escherichia coli]|nr:hypothetical protein [Escherichia coli]